MRTPLKALTAYLLLTYGVVSLAVIPFATGALPSWALGTVVPVAQWTPALAAVVGWWIARTGMPLREAMALRRPDGGWARTALAVLGVFAAILTVHLGLALATGATAWAPVEGAWLSALLVLPVAAATMLTTFGEEVGWRGWLSTVLAPLGALRTAVLVGVIWSTWHLPLLLTYLHLGEMSGRELVVTSVNLVLGALVLSGLRQRTGSVWPAVLGHALMNSLVVFGHSSLVTPSADLATGDYWLLAGLGWLVWGAAAVAVWPRRAAGPGAALAGDRDLAVTR